MGILLVLLMLGVVVALSRLWASACTETPGDPHRAGSDSH
jgi:hypothetical protein